MTPDDYVKIDNYVVKYSNVIKNYRMKNQWKTFNIKVFDVNGEFTGTYMETDILIFKEPTMLPYTLQFNPELLI